MTEYELSPADKATIELAIKTAVDGLYAQLAKCMDSLEELTDPLVDEIVRLKRRVTRLETRDPEWDRLKKAFERLRKEGGNIEVVRTK